VLLIYDLPAPLGLSEELDNQSDKVDYDGNEVLMSPDRTLMVNKVQIKKCCDEYDLPIIMGGIKKVHYIGNFSP
jgi:hypothetical protein